MNRVEELIRMTERKIDDIYADAMCPSDVAGEFAEDYRASLSSELAHLINPTPEESALINERLGIVALNVFERRVYR